jgi:hypothetical protein
MGTDRIKPGRWWYVLAVFLALAGPVAGFALMLSTVWTILHTGDEFTRLVVPGEHELQLSEPGPYAIYHEYQGVLNDRTYCNPVHLPRFKLRLVSRQTGAEVPVELAAVSSKYQRGNRAGMEFFQFRISTPGQYMLLMQYRSGASRPQTVLAIGKDASEQLGIRAVVGLALLVGGPLLAIIVASVTFLRRRRARRRGLALTQPAHNPAVA